MGDQLYLALSRGVFQNSTKVLVKVRKIQEDRDFTKVVGFFYKEKIVVYKKYFFYRSFNKIKCIFTKVVGSSF